MANNNGSEERLSVLRLIKDAQQKHGLRQGNYLRYRGYCGRRLRRLRRSLKLTHQHKSIPKRSAKFVFRPITVDLVADKRMLEMLVFEVERHWAYAMHLKVEIGDNLHDRRKFHMRQRLRRASKYATTLINVTKACKIADVSTKLEAQAYGSFIRSNLYIELRQWEKASNLLNTARKIYHKFSEINDEHAGIFQTKCQEIDNLIRLCNRIHKGDNKEELSAMKSAEEDLLDLDFNKLTVARPKKAKEPEAAPAVKVLEAMPCKPMFFDISREYKNMIKS